LERESSEGSHRSVGRRFLHKFLSKVPGEDSVFLFLGGGRLEVYSRTSPYPRRRAASFTFFLAVEAPQKDRGSKKNSLVLFPPREAPSCRPPGTQNIHALLARRPLSSRHRARPAQRFFLPLELVTRTVSLGRKRIYCRAFLDRLHRRKLPSISPP